MAAGNKSRLRVLRGHDVPAEARGFAAMLALVRVFGRLDGAMARLVKPFGLTAAHFEVLLCLKTGEGISQQELSDRLLVTKGNTCVTVQKMESAGLIDRRPDPTDQRFHRLYMTDTARRLLAKVMPVHHAMMRQILEPITQAEQKMLHELLVRIDQSFDDMESES
jgi:DNA-binding MarR family transcriptional regulator